MVQIPRHLGPKVLPNFPIFQKLLFYAYGDDSVAIRDTTNNIEATFSRLLSDLIILRNAIWVHLDEDIQTKLLRGEEVYINIVAQGSYEFAIAFFAVLALGAVIVPICKLCATLSGCST